MTVRCVVERIRAQRLAQASLRAMRSNPAQQAESAAVSSWLKGDFVQSCAFRRGWR